MKIVVDGFGGDNAPADVVKACVQAVEKYADLEIVITGQTEKIKACLEENGYTGDKIEIVEAPDVISCEDANPAMAIRQKPNSSLVVALNVLKEREDVVALVSAGSTGAVLSGGFLKIGRLSGVSRPALAPMLPTKKADRAVLLLDCGANADCKPENLRDFAIMGSVYYSKMFGVEKPKVALLSNGTEDAKGKELTKAAFDLLKNIPINFVGNMEARDIVSGEYDVVVADGFSGNVALKSIEGAAMFVLHELKANIKNSTMAKVGAMFMKSTFRALKAKLDYKQYGGSLFLGCKKNLFKAHGDSKAEAFLKCIDQAVKTAGQDVNAEIEKVLAEIQAMDESKGESKGEE